MTDGRISARVCRDDRFCRCVHCKPGLAREPEPLIGAAMLITVVGTLCAMWWVR